MMKNSYRNRIYIACLFVWIIFLNIACAFEDVPFYSAQPSEVSNGIDFQPCAAEDVSTTTSDMFDEVAKDTSRSSEWWYTTLITIAGIVGSLFFGYCVYIFSRYIIRGNKGAIRLAVFISVLWIIGVFCDQEPYDSSRWNNGSWSDFGAIGIIPVIVYWGILWVIAGFFIPKESGRFTIKQIRP